MNSIDEQKSNIKYSDKNKDGKIIASEFYLLLKIVKIMRIIRIMIIVNLIKKVKKKNELPKLNQCQIHLKK